MFVLLVPRLKLCAQLFIHRFFLPFPEDAHSWFFVALVSRTLGNRDRFELAKERVQALDPELFEQEFPPDQEESYCPEQYTQEALRELSGFLVAAFLWRERQNRVHDLLMFVLLSIRRTPTAGFLSRW